MEKKILIYLGSNQQKKEAVERVLRDLHIPYMFIDQADILHTTGYLMGMEGYDERIKDDQQIYESDLMILKDIEDDEIHAINALLQTMNVEMKRKAMLTEHNVSWFVCDLLKEIEKEHRYFAQMEEIRNILMSSKDLIIEEYTKDSWSAYEQAFYKAYDCVSKSVTPEEMNDACQTLIQAKQNLTKV